MGTFYTLFEELRRDGSTFFNFFRMSAAFCDELHEMLKNEIQRQNIKMRNCIPSQKRLALTLR